ncbi:MAG: tRNA-dihydrouridine synthase family protein [Acidobacteriota bacterium]
MSLTQLLQGAVVMAPMTKGSNLPYRRLCVELGASITVSEMTVAKRLKQKRPAEFALIRRFAGEPCFGVQIAAIKPDEAAWAAALVEARGADFVDINCGCPIDSFTRRGFGASLGRQPNRMRRLVEAVKNAVTRIPVTAKIRLGWSDEDRNYLTQARAVVDGGASAIFVHGRTRNARYRLAADWDAIGRIAASVPVPVVGNGDLLFPHEIEDARQRSGCAGVMVARAALIKPWIFREARHGYWNIAAHERLGLYRRYATLAREHWGTDDHGLARVRTFVRWHLDFWCRYHPQLPDGTFPTMQGRLEKRHPRDPLEALLARPDAAALDYLAEQLSVDAEVAPDFVPAEAPRVEATLAGARSDREVEG